MTGELRALTLHQPWASLVAAGVKTIETRGRPTSYRGRLLIHAGKRPLRDVPRDRGPFGDYRVRMVGRYGTLLEGPGIEPWCHRTGRGGLLLPLGAVVASCQLMDCVPMVEHVGRSPQEPGAWYVQPLRERYGWPEEWWLCQRGDRGADAVREITDQVPYGGFAPGRWAWLLEDVKPTTERCPRCWGAKELREGDEREIGGEWITAWRDCPVCECAGVCAPVSMRGRQGLWIPNEEDWGG